MSNSTDSLAVTVYGSNKRADTYLYLPEDQAPEELPEQLKLLLGELRVVLTLQLTAERFLANAHAPTVLAALDSQGYYVQLPPNPTPGTRGATG